MRPMVRPGLNILRRDLRTIQLGLEWPGLATLSDTPAIRAVLGAIDEFRDAQGVILAAAANGVSRQDCEAALAALVECGAVIDQAQASGGTVDEATWSAWWLLAGPGHDARTISNSRAAVKVLVEGQGAVATEVSRLLPVAHLNQAHDVGDAALVVVASDGEPVREGSDALIRGGVPHLWAYLRDLVGVVGPFVIPGDSACLRCVDAARAELDPAWLVLVSEQTAQPLRVAPRDQILVAVVAALAVHEAAVWASELRPQTQDGVLEVPHGCGEVQREAFVTHPHCGCGWPVWQDTMGA